MTAAETKELIEVLRAAGVIHYKSPELELTLAAMAPVAAQAPPAAPEAKDVRDPIKEKIEEMKSVMNMTDNELADRLFPIEQQEKSA